MKSKLLIGCNSCENELKKKSGYFLGVNGDYHLMFPVRTSYAKEDLGQLFIDHYTCPFCNGKLEITPNMMKWITSFMDKTFHVQVKEGLIEFSNGEISFSVPVGKEIDSVQEYLASLGVILLNACDSLPSHKEISLVQMATKEYDHSKWLVRVESGKAIEPFVDTYNIWFDGL